METFQGRRTSPPPHSHVTSLYQEHVDPYSVDPQESSRNHAPSSVDKMPVYAPPNLYTPSDGRASSSQRQQQPSSSARPETTRPRGFGASDRRVAVNSVAVALDRTGSAKSQYSPTATPPPKRPPLVQVYNPVAANGSTDAAPARVPSTRAPGSQVAPTPREASRHASSSSSVRVDSSSHASSLQLKARRGTMTSPPSQPTPKSRHAAGSGGGFASASPDPVFASSSRPSERVIPAGSLNASYSTNLATGGGGNTDSISAYFGSRTRKNGKGDGDSDPPLVDLFSAVEEENPQEAKGPLAVSVNTIRKTKYVSQSAYTQRNPFRTQTFADFAAHPLYNTPEHFLKYPEAVSEGVAVGTRIEGNRAMLGEFLLNRLVDLAQPLSEDERNDMILLLNNTLETLQEGDWFYKWTRTNKVHRRFFWLNMQRGTLAWSTSPTQSLVWNSELKISEVTSVKPDCIRDGTTDRSFYRMFISTAGRTVCLATEMPEKFDFWFKAIEQLTLPNLSNGVPGMWGRPTSVLNNGRRGAVGRWASRCSPLQAIADGAVGSMDGLDLRPGGRVLSSD